MCLTRDLTDEQRSVAIFACALACAKAAVEAGMIGGELATDDDGRTLLDVDEVEPMEGDWSALHDAIGDYTTTDARQFSAAMSMYVRDEVRERGLA